MNVKRLKVLSSQRGFYIGIADEEGMSRESRQYWKSSELAEAALRSGDWEGRVNPEFDSSFANLAEFEAARAAAALLGRVALH